MQRSMFAARYRPIHSVAAPYVINYGTIIITIPSASLTAPSATNYGNMVAHGGLIDFDPLTNFGTMSADSGGQISVTGATVDNGTITANSGGTVYLGGAVTGINSPITSPTGHDTSGSLNGFRSFRTIACVGEVVCAFSGAESSNQFPEFTAEAGNRSLSRLAQKRFQFAESLLDWIEIRLSISANKAAGLAQL